MDFKNFNYFIKKKRRKLKIKNLKTIKYFFILFIVKDLTSVTLLLRCYSRSLIYIFIQAKKDKNQHHK